ncbi:MAG: hypothetical protein J6O90_04135 [Candidatus Methanomethylophilaceae archaeon]|nr:hypothetical protein [Candidatus Methanomethylophilaceae archaeon]
MAYNKDNISMGYGSQGSPNKKVPGQGPNSSSKNKPKAKTKEAVRKQAMLNTHKLNPFKYDMNELLAATSMDEAKASAFLASVIAKASRVSTKEAKDFIRGYVDSGDLTKEESDKMCRLLDRYSKFR